MVLYTYMESPVGQLLLAAREDGLVLIEFASAPRPRTPAADWTQAAHPLLQAAGRQLHEYFKRRRTQFDLPLSPQGTAFQKKVWTALSHIPYGSTFSYAQLAQSVENPKALRAVGRANACNPLPIVLPCHRVIGSNGTLVGFSGGLPIKKYLLQLEGAWPRTDTAAGA